MGVVNGVALVNCIDVCCMISNDSTISMFDLNSVP